ncbi:MAG TPA: ThuA domain-containing protein [Dictyoglomaceae bacterium]|nr:ThuA domain-containing protein [Dictyoglomaceae bacterium]HOL38889.1 ThuA domain-containing protein [Dictyoglomaceae bacterium]HOP94923.1 ThuA domain-containing protein [Dictyoglomaceae bacterium]HPP15694.1 ThuA domain-containing protein [Dictyoglomaceae bacterium]HPU43533.1 ThuA domain-containing protein [Dictyoglomaceae bacterium]
MRKITALLGDFYHPEEYFKEALDYVVNDEALKDVKLSCINISEFLSNIQEKPNMIIIGRENKIEPTKEDSEIWMNSEIEVAILNYVKDGGIIFAWHSGLASYDPEGIYVKDILRGYFKYHPEKKMVKYYGKLFEKDKNIEFQLIDEHYFVHCDEERTNVFLFSESEDGKSVAGWYHNYEKGKIICLTPAHNESLKDENFRIFLKELIKWLI